MSNNNKTYIIAEAGVNHNGNINLAKKLVVEAKKAGANAIKFQNFFTDDFVVKSSPLSSYQKKNLKKKSSHYEMLKNLEISKNNIKKLYNFSKKIKVDFISTPFDVNSAKILNSLKPKFIKTASPDLSDYFLHKYLSSLKNVKIIISTGMSSIKDIKKCIKFYKKKNIILMHCVSSYPASEKTLNLNCLDLLKNLAHKIGFSDHTLGNLASIVAVSKGAKFIEKHFTLDKKMKGPDHFFSLNPKELKKYIKNIRLAEKALGAKEKKCQPEEKEVKKISVKSIVASKNLDRGKKITYKNISLKRPGIGMSGFEIKKIIGKKTRRKILKDEIIRFDDFKID